MSSTARGVGLVPEREKPRRRATPDGVDEAESAAAERLEPPTLYHGNGSRKDLHEVIEAEADAVAGSSLGRRRARPAGNHRGAAGAPGHLGQQQHARHGYAAAEGRLEAARIMVTDIDGGASTASRPKRRSSARRGKNGWNDGNLPFTDDAASCPSLHEKEVEVVDLTSALGSTHPASTARRSSRRFQRRCPPSFCGKVGSHLVRRMRRRRSLATLPLAGCSVMCGFSSSRQKGPQHQLFAATYDQASQAGLRRATFAPLEDDSLALRGLPSSISSLSPRRGTASEAPA